MWLGKGLDKGLKPLVWEAAAPEGTAYEITSTAPAARRGIRISTFKGAKNYAPILKIPA